MTGRSVVPRPTPLLAGLGAATPERLRVLLVEDDEGDAFLVRELLAEAGAAFDLIVASSLREAWPRMPGVHCVLLDLGLPDTEGIDGLRRLLAIAGSAAVCVLTGRSDEHLGVAAVAEGAQDYLVKGQVDGVLLSRSLRYAVERKRADENARRLREVELRQAESARLERGLLPQPLMSTTKVAVHTFYRSGRALGLLGGDFFDVVQVGEDRLHIIVGDVCGHSVDEAALGVELRVAWRALVLAGVPEAEILGALEQVLMSERRAPEVFATVVSLTLHLDANRATVRLAGHPPPLLLAGGRAGPLQARTGILLGVRPRPTPATDVALAAASNSRHLETILNKSGPMRAAGESLNTALVDQETGVRGFALSGSETDLEPYLRGVTEEAELLARIDGLLGSEDAGIRTALADVRDRAQRWRSTVAEPVIAAVRERGTTAGQNLITTDARTQFEALRNAVTELQRVILVLRDNTAAAAQATGSTLVTLEISAAVVVVLAAIVLLLLLDRLVSRPLLELAAQVRTVADGDYERQISSRGSPELVRLADDIDAMRRQIASELAQVREAVRSGCSGSSTTCWRSPGSAGSPPGSSTSTWTGCSPR